MAVLGMCCFFWPHVLFSRSRADRLSSFFLLLAKDTSSDCRTVSPVGRDFVVQTRLMRLVHWLHQSNGHRSMFFSKVATHTVCVLLLVVFVCSEHMCRSHQRKSKLAAGVVTKGGVSSATPARPVVSVRSRVHAEPCSMLKLLHIAS